jgi:hypothetical protein
MKATLGSINTLKSFETWNDHFVIIPPRRFVVFGEGKQASLRGVAVEGYLNEEFQDCNAYSFRDLFSGNFKPSTTKFNPIRKIDFFDQLIGAPAITHFTLGSDELKLLRKIDARKFTHIRFYKKPTGVTTARAFNVCKYFASAVSTSEINDYAELQMKSNASSDFYFYIELNIIKKLPIDDYNLTPLINEMISFESVETGLNFYMRDQRLGEKMDARVEDLGSYDEILFIDPSRLVPTKSNWKDPESQPR